MHVIHDDDVLLVERQGWPIARFYDTQLSLQRESHDITNTESSQYSSKNSKCFR